MRVKIINKVSEETERPVYLVQQDEHLLSIEKVSERLNLGIVNTRKLIKKGYLDYLQITREKSILASSLNEFIQNNKNRDLRDLLRD